MPEPTRDELNRWAAERRKKECEIVQHYNGHLICANCGSSQKQISENFGICTPDFCEDLNAAWELADKISVDVERRFVTGDALILCFFGKSNATGMTPAEALTRAVYAAVNGGGDDIE